MNTLSSFKHDNDPLPSNVSSASKPIYEELGKEELFERCVGGIAQNNNESLNQLIWKITPKILPASSKIVDIAACVAAGTFSEGVSALLLFMHGMDLKLVRTSYKYARKEDEDCIIIAEKSWRWDSRRGVLHRQEQKDALDIAAAAGSLLYVAGIDDSM